MRFARTSPGMVTLITALILLVVGGLIGRFIYNTAREMVVLAQFELPEPPSMPIIQPGNSLDQQPVATVVPVSTVPAAVASATAQATHGRVNVLLLGLDVPDQGAEPARADTIIVASLDPAGGPVSLLSIPRDLWVPIGPYGENRINTAYFLGEVKDYPGLGPGLMRATIEQNLDIPIDYHVSIDFDTFREAVDYVGGVTINVTTAIYDQSYPDGKGGEMLLEIPIGTQRMNGEMALAYARSRHGNSDFDRSRRQQEVMLALRDEILRGGSVATVLPRIPSIYRTFSTRMETDLTLDELISLGRLAASIDLENVESYSIDMTMTSRYITADGWDVLLPIPEKIEVAVDRFLRTAHSDGPGEATNELQAIPGIAEENASIAVENGSGRPGLAEAAAEYLRAQGFRVVSVAEAQRSDYPSSIVVNYREVPATMAGITATLQLTSANTRSGVASAGQASADIVVVLGQDFSLSP